MVKVIFAMKKFLLSILITFITISILFAQNSVNVEVQKLYQELSVHYKKGELAEAVSVAEIIVKIHRKGKIKNLENLAIAIKNLAVVKNLYDKKLKIELLDKSTTKERKSEILKIKFDHYKNIPGLFEEAIRIFEKKLKTESLHLAEAKFEYAQYISIFQGQMPARLFDIEQAESLFLEALSIRSNLLGKNDDSTLFTLITVANFYQMDANFEKSTLHYQNYIDAIEAKYGKKSKFLVPALRGLAYVLMAIQDQNTILDSGQSKESSEYHQKALDLSKQISTITGEKKPLQPYGLDLTLRNKDDEVGKLIENESTITRYLKKQKWVMVMISVDEKGNVIEVNAKDPNEQDIFKKDVKEKADKDVKKWKFKPFIYEGIPRKLSGIVWYPYFIKA